MFELAGVFLIKDQKIINEYKLENSFDIPDFLKIIIDPDEDGICIQTSVFECKKLGKKKSSFSKRSSKLNLDKLVSDESVFIISLNDLLNTPKYRKHFKYYLIQDKSLENMLFLEEVEIYKQLGFEERKVRSEMIYSYFIETNSLYEINISNELKIDILENMKFAKLDLFDVLYEYTKKNMIDSYMRFITTDSYFNMLMGIKKINKN
jgi:hypothetical protein